MAFFGQRSEPSVRFVRGITWRHFLPVWARFTILTRFNLAFLLFSLNFEQCRGVFKETVNFEQELFLASKSLEQDHRK